MRITLVIKTLKKPIYNAKNNKNIYNSTIEI